MSSKTRIVVLHMKEVIYTAIFLLLGLLMIILLLIMFGPSKDKETAASVQTVSYTHLRLCFGSFCVGRSSDIHCLPDCRFRIFP